MLLVLNPLGTQKSNQNGLTKLQDEYAYFKLVESIIYYALGSDSKNYPMLLLLKTLMHKNFLSLKQQEGVVRGLKAYFEAIKKKFNEP